MSDCAELVIENAQLRQGLHDMSMELAIEQGKVERLEADLRLQHDIRVELEAKLASARQALKWAANTIPCTEHERDILLGEASGESVQA